MDEPSHSSDPFRPTRRDALRSIGVGVTALVAGCTGDRAGDDEPKVTVSEAAPTDGETGTAPATTSTATATSTATTSPTATEEFPPTPQPSETPDGGALSPSGTWSSLAADRGNTGQGSGGPFASDPTWSFYTRSTTPVVDDRLYTIEFARDRLLVARDAATGEQAWTAPVDGGGTGPAPALTADGIVVQAYTTLQGYTRDGDRVWQTDIGQGHPGAPAVADGVVYGCNGEFQGDAASVFAYTVDGEAVWTVDVDFDVRGSPAVGADVVVVAGEGGVRAFDRATGERAWTTDVAAAGATPAVAGGTAYVAAAETLYALDLADGEASWTAGLDGEAEGPPAVGEETVVVGADAVVAFDRADGTERWTAAHGGMAAPTIADDVVYVGGEGFDNTDIYALTLADGEVRWSHRTDEQYISDYVVAGVRGSPAAVDGALYVAAADGLRAFGPE